MMSVDRPVERDADLEITMVDDCVSSKQKRLNLLDFLIQSPPPEPLHWTSFRDYIVNRFGLVYPEKIIKDVFQHIDRAITKKRYVSAVIDLDSDEEHANSNNQGRGNRDSSCFSVPQPIAFTESINGAFSRSVEDADDSCSFNILDDSPINREEFEEFRRNPVVKHYSKLLKDIYNILKEIKESTSCRVCSKLRYRYLKYTEVVSKDSELLRKTRSDQETADVNSSSRVQRPRRKSSTDKSYFQLMTSKFLTEKEADKIREAIMMDN
uniref:Cytochrome c-L n=1 Tax=Lygus hesperus TaxID=30085 RepID=A0A0A9WCQ7_LYGHE